MTLPAPYGPAALEPPTERTYTTSELIENGLVRFCAGCEQLVGTEDVRSCNGAHDEVPGHVWLCPECAKPAPDVDPDLAFCQDCRAVCECGHARAAHGVGRCDGERYDGCACTVFRQTTVALAGGVEPKAEAPHA